MVIRNCFSRVTRDLQQQAQQALSELGAVFTALGSETTTNLLAELERANRLCLYGVGREGLMMKAFAMRLFHLGLDAHVVGDMTTPPVGEGDALIASAGPGAFSTVLGLLNVAKTAGARTVVITAQPEGRAAQVADVTIYLPAQTMANDTSPSTSVLPMGSLFEASQLLFFDLVVLQLRERLGQSPEAMRRRHTNLE